MLFNTLISFLLLALTPLFVFAQETSSSSTTTIRTTVTSTEVTYVTMTGSAPTSTAPVNATIATPSPSTEPFPGAAPGTFRVSSGLGAAVIGAIVFGML